MIEVWSVSEGRVSPSYRRDELWLEGCLDPEDFRPKEAAALCESWVDKLSEGA